MKWSNGQIEELKNMCALKISNAGIASHFGVPVAEIYAKRSQLGITIPKVKAAAENTEFSKAVKSMFPISIKFRLKSATTTCYRFESGERPDFNTLYLKKVLIDESGIDPKDGITVIVKAGDPSK